MTREDSKKEMMNANLDKVAAILDELGYDPIRKMVESRLNAGLDLNDIQRVTIDRWVAPYVHAQKKAVELTGPNGGPIPLVLSLADERI